MKLSAILFDCDGLILDTERVVYQAWCEDYAQFGVELPLETYVQCVGSGFGGFDPKQFLEAQLGESVDWAQLDPPRDARAHDLADQLPALPGVRELMEEAKDSGLAVAVASSSPLSWVGHHVERLGLSGFVDAIRCVDHVEKPKPAPDVFLAAAAALEVPPQQCLVLEDSRNGLIAAQAAGCACAVVPNDITRFLDFSEADQILSSLAGVTSKTLEQLSLTRFA